MKAVIRLVALAALLAPPAEARQLKNVLDAPQPYKDAANGFVLKYPGGWRVSTGDDHVAFYAQGPRPGEAFFITRPSATTKDFGAVSKEAQKAFPKAKAVTIDLNGSKALRLDQEAVSGGQKYHARTYIVLAGKRVFNVTMRCLASDYAAESAAFDNIQTSLKFNK
jgi:hypothetical protein